MTTDLKWLCSFVLLFTLIGMLQAWEIVSGAPLNPWFVFYVSFIVGVFVGIMLGKDAK